jgi:hypothetical protein
MLEWVILPALVLVVLLTIATAKPKGGGDDGNDDHPQS